MTSKVSSLLAAKALVLARLLHRALLKGSEFMPLTIQAGRRLAYLHQKLLRWIDRRLARSRFDPDILTQDLTAFALATSSPPSDVMRHFQHLRKQAIISQVTLPDRPGANHAADRLQVLLSTLRESRAIFPHQLSSTLRALETQPLLKDEELLYLDELQLDVHARWLGQDTQHYTPWTRHDELRKPMVEGLVKSWAREAVALSIRAISKDLLQEHDIRQIAKIRRDVLQMWLSSRQDFSGLNTRQLLNELRTIFNQAIETVMSRVFTDLQDSLCCNTSDTLNAWTAHIKNEPCQLWNSDLLTMDLGDGAVAFKRVINRRRIGLHVALDPILDDFSSKINNIADIRVVIADMRKTRWDDDAYADEEDASVDVDIDEIPNQLSKEDPSTLEAAIRRNADLCIFQIEATFTKQVIGDLADCSSATAPGLFVIRLIREIRQRLPTLASHSSAHHFGAPLLHNLHSALTSTVSANTCRRLTSATDTIIATHSNVSALWEGAPPLPAQPSPSVYMYLYTVVKEMGRLGPDLWVPMVVARVKDVLCRVVADEVARAMGALVKLEKRPVDDSNDDNERRSEEHMQQYETPGEDVGAAKEVLVADENAETPAQEEVIGEESQNLDDTAVSRMLQSSAAEDDASGVEQPAHEPTPINAVSEKAEGDKLAPPASSSPALSTESESHIPDINEAPTPAKTEVSSPLTQTASESTAPGSQSTQPPSSPPNYDAQAHQKLTQLLFDTFYLQLALSVSTPLVPPSHSCEEDDVARMDGQALLAITTNALIGRCVEVMQDAREESRGGSGEEMADVEPLDMLRLRRSAEACWRRGYLLFGLLWGGYAGVDSVQSAT